MLLGKVLNAGKGPADALPRFKPPLLMAVPAAENHKTRSSSPQIVHHSETGHIAAPPSGKALAYALTAIAVCLCGLLPISAVYVYGGLHTAPSQPVAKETLQPGVTLPAPDLALRVSRPATGQLDLAWSRSLPKDAATGQLEIVDGAVHRHLNLDQTQLRSGKLTYFSSGEDISFRLNVALQSGPPVSESVRVLGAAAPGTRVASSGSGAKPRLVIADRGNRSTPMRPVEQRAQLLAPVPLSGPSVHGVQPAARPPKEEDTSQTAHPALPGVDQPANPPVSELKAASEPKPSVQKPIVSAPPDRIVAAVESRQPQPIRQVIPNIREMMPTGVSHTMRIGVDVTVDKKGRVIDARTTTGVSFLTNACLSAARQWNFTPASLDHKPIEGKYSITFVFRPTAQ